MVNNIAIIPARGGSKRIEKKNIIEFQSKPMIAWTIEAAIQSNLFDKVIVSTDDEEIAAVSRKFGAEVPFLREENVDDHSPVSLATVNCLEMTQDYYKQKFDNIVQLMPNCPLRNFKDIVNSYSNFCDTNAEFQVSVFKYGWMNPWWAAKNVDGKFSFIFPDAVKSRSQDLEDLFCPTGAIWIAKSKALLETKSFHTETTTMYELDWKNALDIDNYDDLELANAVALI